MSNNKLIIYGTIETWEFDSWIIGFNKVHPNIKIEYLRKYVYGTPPPMSTQITHDLSNTGSSADIVLSAISPHLQMQNQDLFQVYNSPERRNIPESFKDSEGFWTSVVLLPTMQIYNRELIGVDEVPKSSKDLLDNRWKNRISIHDITLGTFGSNWISSLRSNLTGIDWSRFINLLSHQNLQLWPLFRHVLGSVSLGKSDIGLTVMFYEYLRAKDKNLPIERLILSDIPLYISATVASILKTSSNLESAKLFIDYILSKEGQNMIGNNYIRVPAYIESDSKYSISNILPNEKYSIFPSLDVINNTDNDRQLFQNLFKNHVTTDEAFNTDVDKVLKK